ncbi:carbohydrate kinase family protein [Microbacterium sp. YY-01]|uniref:carbohydrate kinase family protein n=1 Tax=Microbacterium sp. YY-01 TaxID=3421634 RepID=UPI003D16563C
MTRSVLVVGEVLVDAIGSAADPAIRPGGSPANVAIGLARLGFPAELVTAYAQDTSGEIVKQWVEDSGVTLSPESAIVGSTAVARATLDSAGVASYEFDIDWSLPRFSADILSGRPLVHVGSLGMFLEPGASRVAELVRLAASEGIPVSVDANIRPSALPDPHTARVQFENIVKRSSIVKLSDEDAAYLYPGLSAEGVVARLHSLPSMVGLAGRTVALTQGENGALIGSDSEVVRVFAPRTNVVDTIGAGDSFMSGLIYWLLMHDVNHWFSRDTLVDAGNFAVKCAAITVARAGANPPHLDEVENFYAAI